MRWSECDLLSKIDIVYLLGTKYIVNLRRPGLEG